MRIGNATDSAGSSRAQLHSTRGRRPADWAGFRHHMFDQLGSCNRQQEALAAQCRPYPFLKRVYRHSVCIGNNRYSGENRPCQVRSKLGTRQGQLDRRGYTQPKPAPCKLSMGGATAGESRRMVVAEMPVAAAAAFCNQSTPLIGQYYWWQAGRPLLSSCRTRPHRRKGCNSCAALRTISRALRSPPATSLPFQPLTHEPPSHSAPPSCPPPSHPASLSGFAWGNSAPAAVGVKVPGLALGSRVAEELARLPR